VTTFAQALATKFAPLAADYDTADVTEALSWAQSFVESYCNRTFDLVTDDVVVIDPYSHSAMLPSVPVVEVTLVEGYIPGDGGMAWTELTNFFVKNDTGLLYDTTGLPGTIWPGCYSWPWLPGSLRVTYTHGYDPIPNAVLDAAVRLATQWLENKGLRVQLKVGDIEERFNGSSGVTLNAMDQGILDQYSIVSIA
jgi:hypothetical protein